MIAHRIAAGLQPDPARVIARLFLPGEELHGTRSRASQVVGRVMSLAEGEVERLAAALLHDFGDRHHDYQALLQRHASIVSAHVEEARELTAARTLLLGATFTAEYATEGAALCNPSAVLGPTKGAYVLARPGWWSACGASVKGTSPRSASARPSSALARNGLSNRGSGRLPWRKPRRPPGARRTCGPFSPIRAISMNSPRPSCAPFPLSSKALISSRLSREAHHDLLSRTGSAMTADLLRTVVSSAYEATFARDADLGQRVLWPAADEESNGMEDARFTRFTGDDGTAEYRATYTAYDGQRIAPRLLISPDLRTFRAHRLAGPAARNKGMALFPRKVNGQHLALCRSDGESTSLAISADGYAWDRSVVLQEPSAPWEMLQVGNCGPPIETDQGWLVLTHGVGPMRVYVIGTLLLDLDDPTRVVGYSKAPLLSPGRDEQDGYVPNVVYSCGAFLHDGLLWIPYGIDDRRIGVAYAPLDEVLADLSSAS